MDPFPRALEVAMNVHDFASLAFAWIVASSAAALWIAHLIRRGRGQAGLSGDEPADDGTGCGPVP